MQPFTYHPPICLSTDQPNFSIAQLSDLHLTGKIGEDASYQRFLAVLDLALDDDIPDLFLLTGDLVNDGNTDGYDWLFRKLNHTGVPFISLAGNHDVTHEIGIQLPHHERTHIALMADDRLVNHYRLPINLPDSCWQLLCLDSSVAGCEFGLLGDLSLDWLDSILCDHPQPSIIALHHHPVAVGSAWIDALMLSDADKFISTIAKHSHVHAVLCGHVHQAHALGLSHTATLYTCPATARQFAPLIDHFSLDDVPAGLRMIHINNNSQLSTYIKRRQN